MVEPRRDTYLRDGLDPERRSPDQVRSAATGFHDNRWHAGFWGQVSGVRKRQCGRHRALGALLMGLLLIGSWLRAKDRKPTDLPAFAVCGDDVECSHPLLTTRWTWGPSANAQGPRTPLLERVQAQ